MGKIRIISAIALTALLLYYFNSYNIALISIGLNKDMISFFSAGIDNNNREYRVVGSFRELKQPARFAYLTKNQFGIWRVGYSAVANEDGFAALGWMGKTSIRRFSAYETPLIEWESHNLYYGDNAIKLIEFPPEYLPNNVAVKINQVGEEYILHFVSFGDNTILNDLDVWVILDLMGYVAN